MKLLGFCPAVLHKALLLPFLVDNNNHPRHTLSIGFSPFCSFLLLCLELYTLPVGQSTIIIPLGLVGRGSKGSITRLQRSLITIHLRESKLVVSHHLLKP